MYFVMGAMVFSAYALLGTPQRVIAKGSDAFYALPTGRRRSCRSSSSAARVRRIGAREGLVTQAEFLGERYDSRLLTLVMGLASLLAFVPYIVIQFKGAGVVMQQVLGWHPLVGRGCGLRGRHAVRGVRGDARGRLVQRAPGHRDAGGRVGGSGWRSRRNLFGGVGPMSTRDRRAPAYLSLPGPGAGTSDFHVERGGAAVDPQGSRCGPQVFMKCFTARSARLVQHSAVV
jgi:SSS family solute:Na+ symporter